MLESKSEVRLRYPLFALALIGVSWCFYAVVVLSLALFMLPIVPLAPVFVMVMVGLGGLLSSVHEYARAVATPVQAATLRTVLDGKIPEAPRATPESSKYRAARAS